MNTHIYLYQLKSKNPLNALGSLGGDKLGSKQDGALIKIALGDQWIYCDLHPWPSLGEGSLSEHLLSLKNFLSERERLNRQINLHSRSHVSSKDLLRSFFELDSKTNKSPIQGSKVGHLTPLVQQSLRLGARLFESGSLPKKASKDSAVVKELGIKNNYLVPPGALSQQVDFTALRHNQFSMAKIKCGINSENETELIEAFADNYFRLRLDFNSSASEEKILQFWSRLSQKAKNSIEYIEDPCRFDQEIWSRLNLVMPLACDFEISRVDWSNDLPFKYWVVKPSRHPLHEVLEKAKLKNLLVTCTSAMDHPLGIISSLVNWAEFSENKEGPSAIDSTLSPRECVVLRPDLSSVLNPISGFHTFGLHEPVWNQPLIEGDGRTLSFYPINIQSYLDSLHWLPIEAVNFSGEIE